MAQISRSALFRKLHPLVYKAAEGAYTFCRLRGNPKVEPVHWLVQLLNAQELDLHRIVRHFDLDVAKLTSDCQAVLERLPRGASGVEDFSELIPLTVKEGWMYASLQFGASVVRSGHLLIGQLRDERLRSTLLQISREFDKIKVEALSDDFCRIAAGSAEDQPTQSADAAQDTTAMAPAPMGRQDALKRFALDLTARARSGLLDPVSGRDQEIRQIIDVLMRRRQNNPILTGEAGVGKTAVVEGFASRIVRGDVPPALQQVSLWVLDVGLLQAGASMKGEFESRLRQVIDEVQASPTPIILFIDEAHTLIGAGGAAGTGDAANLLKPALARGTLRTIAATTWGEYKKYFEKDPALTRRFQVVQVAEPAEEQAIEMVRGVAAALERHHGVELQGKALEAAVRLSHRYIPARQLPDKAVSLLDTACARVALSQQATPPQVEDAQRRIEALERELNLIEREHLVGIDPGALRAEKETMLEAQRTRLADLHKRWQEEKKLVEQILPLRQELRGADAGRAARPTLEDSRRQTTSDDQKQAPARLGELERLQAQLAALQGEQPLIMPSVDAQAVAAVVADWTGIPVGRMLKDEAQSLLKLETTLGHRVIGQQHGLKMIADRIRTSRKQLSDARKPVGVFMLCGPSGVGKTETALALAETLYGGEQNLITINMSEFQEAHTVSTLKGAPPGYVGYGEGGVLTEAVRRRPYSVVLLDEVEKAHPDVHELFFQVFDKGWMEDGEGRHIDFKNTVILLTSNVGTELIMQRCQHSAQRPDIESLAAALRPALLKVFPAALLGRLVVVPYQPLSDATLGDIVRLQLERIRQRVADNHKVPLIYDEAAVKLIISRCAEVESGGRMIDAILTNTVLPKLSEELLQRAVDGRALRSIRICATDREFSYAFDEPGAPKKRARAKPAARHLVGA